MRCSNVYSYHGNVWAASDAPGDGPQRCLGRVCGKRMEAAEAAVAAAAGIG